MNAYGIAPCSRIHATAQQVSSPPENAMPTRSPTGSEPRIAPQRDASMLTSSPSRWWWNSRGEVGAGEAVARGDEDGVVAGDRARDLGQPGGVDRVGERRANPRGVCMTSSEPDGISSPAQRRSVDGQLVEPAQVGGAGERVDEPSFARCAP